jgi:hypothetical protein
MYEKNAETAAIYSYIRCGLKEKTEKWQCLVKSLITKRTLFKSNIPASRDRLMRKGTRLVYEFFGGTSDFC